MRKGGNMIPRNIYVWNLSPTKLSAFFILAVVIFLAWLVYVEPHARKGETPRNLMDQIWRYSELVFCVVVAIVMIICILKP